jgi:hypothetical protein
MSLRLFVFSIFVSWFCFASNVYAKLKPTILRGNRVKSNLAASPTDENASVGSSGGDVASRGNINTMHEVAGADAMLTAFGGKSLSSPLNVKHCLSGDSGTLVKNFESLVTPNPIVRGSPLVISSSGNLKQGLSSGNFSLDISAFAFPVLTVTENACVQNKVFNVPTLGDVEVRGFACPVKPGGHALLSIRFTVPKVILPGIQVGVKIKLSDQHGQDVMCEDTSFLT